MGTKALNDICFNQPHWKLIAQGINIERWFNDGQKVGSGGIRTPARVKLKLKHRYYRFVSSTSTRAAQLGGGWWISFDTFNTIRHFAERNHLEFSYAARLFLALPYEWTRLDRVVSAQLLAPIDAYAGEGNVAKTEKDKWTPIQHLKVTQLYIPGLISNSNLKNLYETIWEKDIRTVYAHNRKPV
ncbi:MAG: hypothetical protein OEZ05_14805 [Nitrospirota bacterium]|nr:hypothetical protein [Nitrospirota bacterium]